MKPKHLCNKSVTSVTKKCIDKANSDTDKCIPRKPTKKQLKIIKEAWATFELDYDEFHRLVRATEEWMRKETGIKELEFIHDSSCMGWIGVGTFPPDMKLLHAEDLSMFQNGTEGI